MPPTSELRLRYKIMFLMTTLVLIQVPYGRLSLASVPGTAPVRFKVPLSMVAIVPVVRRSHSVQALIRSLNLPVPHSLRKATMTAGAITTPMPSPGQGPQANLWPLSFGSICLWQEPLPSPRTPVPRGHRIQQMPIFPRMHPIPLIMRLPHVMHMRTPPRTRTHPVL